MSLNGRVHPDCNYAANPFHECTESCLRKIAEGKGQKVKKKTGSFIDISKKLGKGRKYESELNSPYASEENAGSFIDISKKLGKGRKYESELNSPYASEGSKPRSRVYSTEKVESDDHSSSMSLSEEFNLFENTSINKEKVPLVPTTGILSKPGKTNVNNTNEVADSSLTKPSTNEGNDEMNPASTEAGRNIDKKGEGKTGSGSRSISLSMLGIDINSSFEESDEEEAESIVSDSSVSFGKYRVKESSSFILQMIFDKYGDIAANCQLESIAMQSYYLQSVCSVIQELQSISMKQLTKSKVREILAILKDVESAGIDIGWLCRALAETVETIELMNQHRAFELAKANCERDIESMRKQLESQAEELALKEKEVTNLKRVVAETRAHLRELELKSSVLGENIGSIKSKVDMFQSKSVLDGVF